MKNTKRSVSPKQVMELKSNIFTKKLDYEQAI